jgi:hypothetical protein
MTLADTVVVMNQGRIEQAGVPTEVYRRPATQFVATFIGSPAMNLMPGRVAAAGVVETSGGRIAFDPVLFDVVDGQQVEVGIRPEDLQFATPGDGRLSFAKALWKSWAPPVSCMAPRAPRHWWWRSPQRRTMAKRKLGRRCRLVHLFDPASGKSLRRDIRGTST